MRAITLLFLVTTFSFYACSEEKMTDEQAKEELMEAINTFNQAFQESDLTTLASMIPSNYVHTNGNSKSIGKEEWFNYLEKRNKEITSGNLEIIRYVMDETEFEFHGNMAILTAKISVTTQKKEEVKEQAYRVTNIWVKESGSWKRAGFHDGKIK